MKATQMKATPTPTKKKAHIWKGTKFKPYVEDDERGRDGGEKLGGGEEISETEREKREHGWRESHNPNPYGVRGESSSGLAVPNARRAEKTVCLASRRHDGYNGDHGHHAHDPFPPSPCAVAR